MVPIQSWSVRSEFVSRTAFLFTLLLLILLATPLHGSVGISCWPKLAFGFLATLMFSSDVGYSLQTRGLPFKSDGALETRNGGVTPAAEEEKLNVPEQ
ncbi:hypothetical protein F7725_016299, partial [Dissostichus mawsoni]